MCNGVTKYVGINGYDTRSAENMDSYLPRCSKRIYKISFLFKDSSIWNQLMMLEGIYSDSLFQT